jgi:hypothetical protein
MNQIDRNYKINQKNGSSVSGGTIGISAKMPWRNPLFRVFFKSGVNTRSLGRSPCCRGAFHGPATVLSEF